VSVEEAGADRGMMAALEALERQGRLPVRVYAMLAARDTGLMEEWLARGPQRDVTRMLVVPTVKVFYDGALGSRGALMLADYSDRPRWRGVKDASFDEQQLARAMTAGFQLSVHAIGDGANRRTLDFYESVLRAHPDLKANRHRIEHAQVLDAADIPRFASLGIIASMQPPHAIEDKGWAEARVGTERIRGAYAWRSLRRAGARLAFNSDLPGTDYDFFYGFHSAVTRQDKRGQPEGGWFPDQRMTPEEALRGYTCWGAYAQFSDTLTGTLQPGKWADITVLSLDPLTVGEREPARLLEGRVLYTIAGGKVVFEGR
jgi:predicted amidohydrolase YtcJ